MFIGTTSFGCDAGKSGISQYLIQLARAFARIETSARFEMLVHEAEKDVFVPEGSRIEPLCAGSGMNRPMLNVAWYQAALPLWCMRRGYDVLFLPAANRRVPVWAPCPTVGTVHDFSSIHMAGKYDPLRHAYITRVLPFLARRLTRVIAISESTKRDVVHFARVPEERVTVIPHGVDTDVFHPRDKEAALARLRSDYGVVKPYLLYISRIEHPGKNHVRLIEAFARLKAQAEVPHQLMLVGSDWTRAEEVHRAADASGCASDIVFAGFVPNKDLTDFYAGADVFVFPSLYEGFGMPILEAMACGVPVACSSVSSLPEVAGDAAVLFDPLDVESMAAALRGLLLSADTRARFAGEGLQRAGRFTWASAAARTLEVIEDAAEQGRRVAARGR